MPVASYEADTDNSASSGNVVTPMPCKIAQVSHILLSTSIPTHFLDHGQGRRYC